MQCSIASWKLRSAGQAANGGGDRVCGPFHPKHATGSQRRSLTKQNWLQWMQEIQQLTSMLKYQFWAKSPKRRKVMIKNRNKKTMRFQPGTRSFCVRPGDRDLQIFDMEGPKLRNTSLNGINCTSITDRHTASVTETRKHLRIALTTSSYRGGRQMVAGHLARC